METAISAHESSRLELQHYIAGPLQIVAVDQNQLPAVCAEAKEANSFVQYRKGKQMIMRSGFVPVAVTVVGLLIAAPAVAFAQTEHKEHHPSSGPTTEAAPPNAGASSSEIPKSGAMGMMGDMMAGSGMMRACPMMDMMMQRGGAETHAKGRVAFLKAELAITDGQKGVWDAFAAALEKNLQGMHGMRQSMMKAMGASSPVERLSAHISAMENRVAALKEIKPALSNLYPALSDDQKKAADKLLTGIGCLM